jgi:hypothetical protein
VGNRIGLRSGVIGFLSAASLFAISGAAREASTEAANIINVAITSHEKGNDFHRVVFDVPADSSLIITDVNITGMPGSTAQIFERSAKNDALKLVATDYSSVTGVYFRPGSQLVLVDSGWSTVSLTGKLAKK